MKRSWVNIVISLVLILALVPLVACIKTSDEGRKTPQRIISLAPSNTEILFALGLADNIVGVTDYCNFPPEAKKKERIGGFSTVDLEKVISLSPDLVLAADIHAQTVVPELERRGITVRTLAPKTLAEVLAGIALVAVFTDKAEEASQLVTEMEWRIKAVAEKVELLPEDEKPSVFYLTWHDPLWTLGTGTITHELIQKAGGINIFADLDGHKTTNLETIIARNPRVIIACTGHGSAKDSPVRWAETEDRLREIDARKNSRVYQVDADLVTRPSPRIVDGLELLAKFIHPEIFGE